MCRELASSSEWMPAVAMPSSAAASAMRMAISPRLAIRSFLIMVDLGMPKRLLIVAHAPSENTLALRAAVERGALSETDIAVRVVAPLKAGPDDVLAAQAVILGTTENLGYMSGALKDFFDRSYNPCLEKTQGLPYVLYIRAGQDGTGTSRAVERITTGLRWRAVQEPLICKGAWQPAFVQQCEELGAAMAAGLAAGIF